MRLQAQLVPNWGTACADLLCFLVPVLFCLFGSLQQRKAEFPKSPPLLRVGYLMGQKEALHGVPLELD
jgi:hypothetical protein